MSAATLPAAAGRWRMPPAIVLALGWILLMVAVAILADLISPTHYATQNLRARLQPPLGWGGTWAYPLGTDAIGRDMLSRLIYGIRFSILIAVLGTLIGAVVGTILGIVAAARRGWVEEGIMMMVDVQAATDDEHVAYGMGDLHLPIGWGTVPYAELLPSLPIRPGSAAVLELAGRYDTELEASLAETGRIARAIQA